MPKKRSKKNKVKKKNEDSLERLFKKKNSPKKKRKRRKSSTKTIEIVYSKKVRGKKGIRKKPSSFPRPKDEENMPIKKNYFPEKVILNNPKKEVLPRKVINKLLFSLIVLFIIVMLLIVAVLSYDYIKNARKFLETNDKVKKAFISEEVLHVELVDNLDDVGKIRFIFLGNREYYVETSDIKLNHQFTPSDLGLNNFEGLEKVSAVFE